jgi:hypothetical protein
MLLTDQPELMDRLHKETDVISKDPDVSTKKKVAAFELNLAITKFQCINLVEKLEELVPANSHLNKELPHD